jgi:hypothetical protein
MFGLPAPDPLEKEIKIMPQILPPLFKSSYKKMFGPFTSDTEAGFEKLCREIENDPEARNMPPAEIAYMIATVWWETHIPRLKQRFLPCCEQGPREYFDKYEPGTKLGDRLGNTAKGDGYLYRGRGYVQITGKDNYRRLSRMLSSDPEVLLGPGAWMAGEALFAYQILARGMREGLFTGKKLADYKRPDGSYNFVGARAIINGKDKANEIAAHAEAVLGLLLKGDKERVA